jgi:SAM-dependent methyltransferase
MLGSGWTSPRSISLTGPSMSCMCNHVFEHVPDDKQAMRELRRVLADDGWAILQAPVDERLEVTLEDPGVVDPD